VINTLGRDEHRLGGRARSQDTCQAGSNQEDADGG
jgi:hypothetical protein